MSYLNEFMQGFEGELPYVIAFGVALFAMVIWWVIRKSSLGRQNAEMMLEEFNIERMKRTGLIDDEELKKVRHGLAGVLQKELETKARGGATTPNPDANLSQYATKLAAELGDQYDQALDPPTEEEKRAQREAVARAEQEWRRQQGMAEKYLDPGLKEAPEIKGEAEKVQPEYSPESEEAKDSVETEAAPSASFVPSSSLADSDMGAVWGDLDSAMPPEKSGAARPNLEAMFEQGVIDAEEYRRLKSFYEEKEKKG